jgi:hypothetical protein
MNIGRVPTKPFESLLDRRANQYTIYEETGGNDDWNGQSTLSGTDTTAQIDVHQHRSSPQSYPTGETYRTQLQGLLSSDEKTDDIENGACIVHGGQVFEMTIDPWPDADSTTVYVLSLEERTDLSVP